MIGVRTLGLSCVLLAACGPEKFDVVARAATKDDAGIAVKADAGVSSECCDAGGPAADGADAVPAAEGADAAVPAADSADAGVGSPNACAGSESFVLLTKEGRVYRVHAETGKLDERGVPACLLGGEIAAAVDSTGKLWAAPADGMLQLIEPDSLDCKPIALNMLPTALAFVYHPDLKRELLYALEAGVLWVVDPVSLDRSPRGKLERSWLAGTADGRLVGLSDRSGGVIEIGVVSTDAGVFTPAWKLIPPSALPLSGAAAYANGFALIFGTSLYRYRIGDQDPQLIAQLFPENPGIVAAAGPACASLPK
jgi:hypothetical protein